MLTNLTKERYLKSVQIPVNLTHTYLDPFALSNFPDITKGKWIKRKSIHHDSKLGFFHILADIPDCEYLPPFPFRKNGLVIFPTGKFETFVTLAELQSCKNQKWFKILDSWQFIPEICAYPYRGFIQNLYLKRLEIKRKGDPLQLPIKIIRNSIYGKTGQRIRSKIGNMFNPVLFSFITGFTRAQLYSFVITNNLDRQVISFATDSVCITKSLDIESEKLGGFRTIQ